MRKKIISCLLLMCIVVACSSEKRNDLSSTPVDSTLFDEGRAHAAEMFECCDDSVKMSLYLLDTRARISKIEEQKGRQPAEDYRLGFEDYVRFHDPELADRLF